MLLKWLLSRHKNPSIAAWLKAQSHPEDALAYLIEKEVFQNGNRDLSFYIPRIRSTEYFEELMEQSSTTVRRNLPPTHRQAMTYNDQLRSDNKPLERLKQLRDGQEHTAPKKRALINEAYSPSSEGLNSKVTSLSAVKGVNRANAIYHQVSSSVVVTAPEEQFLHEETDMSCFDD